ncbi:SSI family serine proteinase inhibitor [Bailinhaonella thermotolerans]|uniref:Protease inhibitor protein n=1 Tax=Bailinhaonella thermotolerans TaxID=1070861 RepID=A0A3A4AYA9_9ACTN|nr:SSI family serine proteinase inhibitor [Bailinhaonella thermotolerans]RJL32486.1 protease inhibitor protein [Bailinhaonella thermotolerans]
MSKRSKRLIVVAALGVVPLSGLTPSAAVAETPWDKRALGKFVLKVTDLGDHRTRTVLLNCVPDGGTHPAPRRACHQLRQAHGRIARIPAEPGPCTHIYRPVRVEAFGTWAGGSRAYSRQFANHCVAVRRTGGVVFRF